MFAERRAGGRRIRGHAARCVIGLVTLVVVGCTSTTTAVTIPVASLEVSPATVVVAVGSSVQLTATPFGPEGATLRARAISWSSSDPGVATVGADGSVTAVGGGSTTITASSEGQTATANVSVPAPVATVDITPPSSLLFIGGGGQQLTATMRDAGGAVLSGRAVTWSSSDPTIAAVAPNGFVTPLAVGTVTITATSELISNTASVEVLEPVASVEVSPTTASLLIGETTTLSATTRDGSGNVLTGRAIAWTSSNPAVATVSADGTVRALDITNGSPGQATITATSEGQQGSTAVTVNVNPTPISLGDLISASISVGGEVDYYSFDANTGDVVVFTLTETTTWGGTGGAYDAQITLFAPSGALVTAFDSNGRVTSTLPADGTYLVRVGGNNAIGFGGYNMGLEGLSPTSPSPTPIALGDLVSGQIVASAESDLYTFSGSVGDVVSFTLTETTSFGGTGGAYDPQLTLFSPAGVELTAIDATARTEYTLPETGDFLVRISANVLFATGSYNLGLEGISPTTPAPTAIALGDLVSGQILASGESDQFTFTAGAGDMVSFTLTETTSFGGTGGAYDAQMTLFGPTGAELTQLDSNGRLEFTLPDAGDYLIRISANVLFATGSYNLGLEGISPTTPAPTAIALGDLVSGQIVASGESDLYTFSGGFGDIVSFTLTETTDFGGTGSAYDAELTLFSPTGVQLTQLDSNGRLEFTLPEAGTYLVRITSNVLFATGSYNLGLEGIAPTTPGPTPITPGDLLSGQLLASAESDLFTFSATAGDILAFTLTETTDFGGTGSAYDAEMTLFDPSGAQLTQLDSNGQLQFTIPTTGAYLMRISSNVLFATGSYNVGLEGIVPASASATALACGTTQGGNISQSGSSDLWTISATVGETLSVTATETSVWGGTGGANDARATVFDPSGIAVASFDSNGNADVVAGVTGTFLVRVSANNLVSVGTYDLGLTCS